METTIGFVCEEGTLIAFVVKSSELNFALQVKQYVVQLCAVGNCLILSDS